MITLRNHNVSNSEGPEERDENDGDKLFEVMEEMWRKPEIGAVIYRLCVPLVGCMSLPRILTMSRQLTR